METHDGGNIKIDSSPYTKLKSIDLGSVEWTDGFWAEQFKKCCETTIPHHWDLLQNPEKAPALQNLKIAAGLAEGEYEGNNWEDAWVHKFIEGLAYIYSMTGDETINL